MIVYVAGPMTGIPDYNRGAFHAAAQRLRANGVTVINPADHPPGHDWLWYMRANLRALAEVDAVVLLPGWRASRGAAFEAQVAATIGLPVHTLADLLGDA